MGQAGCQRAVVDEQIEVLPDRDHVTGHRHLAAPGADRRVAVLVDHQRRRSTPQRAEQMAVRVVTTLCVVKLEAAVEGGEQPRPARSWDEVGLVPQPEVSGVELAWLLDEAHGRAAHPGDSRGLRGAGVGQEVRDLDHGLAVNDLDRVVGALAGRTAGGERAQSRLERDGGDRGPWRAGRCTWPCRGGRCR